MKKILLAAISLVVMAAANAATTSTTLSLSGSVVGSCTSSLSSSTLNFSLVSGQTPTAANTALNFNCVTGTTIVQMTSTSANGWRMSGSNTGFMVPYTISANGHGVLVNGHWSGSAGSTSALNVLALGQNSLVVGTIDTANASSFSIDLTVAPQQVSAIAPVDNYSDTVSFTTTF